MIQDVSVVLGIAVNDGKIGVATFGVFTDPARAQEVREEVIGDLLEQDADVSREDAADAVFVLESIAEFPEVVEGSDG